MVSFGMVFVIVSIFTEQEAPKAEEKPAAVKKGKELTLTQTWLLTDEDVISFSLIIGTFFPPDGTAVLKEKITPVRVKKGTLVMHH